MGRAGQHACRHLPPSKGHQRPRPPVRIRYRRPIHQFLPAKFERHVLRLVVDEGTDHGLLFAPKLVSTPASGGRGSTTRAGGRKCGNKLVTCEAREYSLEHCNKVRIGRSWRGMRRAVSATAMHASSHPVTAMHASSHPVSSRASTTSWIQTGRDAKQAPRMCTPPPLT